MRIDRRALAAPLVLLWALASCTDAPTEPSVVQVLTDTPVMRAARGSTADYVLRVVGLPDGEIPAIDLGALPSGVTATVDPVAPSGRLLVTTVHLSIGDFAVPGTYSIDVTARAGARPAQTVPIGLVVPTPTFEVLVTTPEASLGTITAPVPAQVRVRRIDGFRGRILLSGSSVDGLLMSFADTDLAQEESTTVVTLSIPAVTGFSYSFAIRGSGQASGLPAIEWTAHGVLRLDEWFYISATPSALSVRAGESVDGAVRIARPGPWEDWEMPLGFEGLPAGVTVTAPEGAEYLRSPTFTYVTSTETPPGEYPITIRVRGGAADVVPIAPTRLVLSIKPR